MAEIILKDLSLSYPVYGHQARSLRGHLLSLANAGKIKAGDKTIQVESLSHLNLHLKPGDRLALIGGNGAGKTTLLKTISGIYTPTKGEKIVIGKMTSILGSGFGLDEEASGYQNILLGGVILGFSLKEMRAKFEDIENFTELGDYLNMPLRTYSAGMRVRLAFAIATCVRPDILVIDEGIGVGDAAFFEKMHSRLDEFLSPDSILIMASHVESLLRDFCNKCLYLKNGEAVFFGPIETGLKKYTDDFSITPSEISLEACN